jgi:hypothetical protein
MDRVVLNAMLIQAPKAHLLGNVFGEEPFHLRPDWSFRNIDRHFRLTDKPGATRKSEGAVRIAARPAA